MRNILFLVLLIAFSGESVSAQDVRGRVDSALLPVLSPHYQDEFTFDKSTNPALWNTQQGVHVSFGSENDLYFRTEVPQSGDTFSWTGCGWRGERLNGQIVVWSADTLEQVRFKLGDLSDGRGHKISKNNISLNMVRYVLANYPYGSDKVDCGGSPYKDGYLMPDRFEQFDRFDVPGKTVRPVWMTINIPANTATGYYKGTITVLAKGFSRSLRINIDVQNQILPPPHEWKFRLDLWQNPWVLAWDNHLQPWSEEHKLLLKKHLKLYADAGGKYITTYAVNSPWSDNSYTIEGGMIESVKQKNGTWKFDYKIFDEYVELAMSVGIDKAITVYTPIPGNYRFRYIDGVTGNYITESWPPGSDKFKAYWGPFLNDLKAHLQKKGWLTKTYIGINENPMDETLTAIKFVRANWPGWKITYAGDWHPELKNLLDDYSYVKGKESPQDIVAERRAKGFTTTFYVCCTPPKPNNFLFSPPIEGRWMGWYASAYGYSGFLRWAYDAWPQDPNRDGRHGGWAAGDCYLVYPGANSGIRFEKLREGISDYEKIRILKVKASVSTDKKCKELLARLNEQMEKVAEESKFNEDTLKKQVSQGQDLVRELSDRLARKK
ncbi:MAG TPA: glycoside hydrolase domain-containing protein [Mucilaginibacter sp.]|nr:glycoside hydrolase domain-containing protein [Mucilaginibacter sp.]